MSAFTTLPDHRLLAELHKLVRNDRVIEADLLSHLGEVDKRRLYLREACSSMFRYCVDVLHFSEASAFKRIAAARAAREFPELLESIRRGELHVTAVRMLAPNLTRENSAELIALAKHQTAEQIKQRLADRHPKPDVLTSIRRVARPSPVKNTAAAPPIEPLPLNASPQVRVETESTEPTPNAARPALHASPPPPSKAEPLGGGRYSIRFSASPETHTQLRELQALLRHKFPNGDLGKLLSHAIAVLHKQARKQKFADCEKPRRQAGGKPEKSTPRGPQASARRIPAAIRRAVAKRDEERCTYVSPSGRRCNTRDFLEFHHEIPWVRDRSHTIDNITLRCRAHNQHAADQDFGRQHMAQFSKTRVTDSAPGPLDHAEREARGTGQLALRPVK